MVRLDKWLWAARFYKTRSTATDAVDGGKVKLNGATVKPAKEVKPGDRIRLHAGEQDWEIVVMALNEQRRPAPEARRLYEETPDSAARGAGGGTASPGAEPRAQGTADQAGAPADAALARRVTTKQKAGLPRPSSPA